MYGNKVYIAHTKYYAGLFFYMTKKGEWIYYDFYYLLILLF